jgi:hypothetical protein
MSTQGNHVAVAHWVALKRDGLGCGNQVGHAQLASQGPTARDVVVVDMGLGDTTDANSGDGGSSEDTVGVSLWVDDHSDVAIMQDVGTIAEFRRTQRNDVDHSSPLERPITRTVAVDRRFF